MRPSVRLRVSIGVIFTALCACAWLTPAAGAEFSPIQLVSKTTKEQAGSAKQPALSADGHFVAFVGELGGQSGIFRKDLTTGVVTLVVGGAAEYPSISTEGRFVSFTTTQSLKPLADTQAGSKDVYLADLATPTPTYELVSATEGQRLAGSSTAAPRVAMSADGAEVAFVNEGQVYVHVREAEKPTLITVKRGALVAEPVPGGGALTKAGAAISADGNAVAWVGQHLPAQVPLLADEEEQIRSIETGPESETQLGNRYFEPLWRAVPPGDQDDPVGDPTRRIVGGGDPLAPGCGGSPAEVACQGPFPKLAEDHRSRQELHEAEGVGWGTSLPQLSADGVIVATIGSPEEDRDLFVVDMTPGLSRVHAVHRLTRWINPAPALNNPETVFEHSEYLIDTGPIAQCAISPSGSRIAFTTQRQVFPLSPPTLITPRLTGLPVVRELYQLNLGSQTLERVTPGPGAEVSQAPTTAFESESAAAPKPEYGEAELGASGPSYDADGGLIAFASKAFNIVAGDANEGSDVFTVEAFPSSPVQETVISPRPSALSVIPSWRLTVHAVSRPDGAVRVVAGVPGAGTLRVSAKSKIGTKPAARKVSAGQQSAGAAGQVRLELKLSPKLRPLARRKGGLYTALVIQFTGAGGKPLEQQLVARFRSHHKSDAKKKGKRG